MLKLAAAALVALTVTAAAAPPKGAYKLVSIKEASKTTLLDDVFKAGFVQGEVIFEFYDDKLLVGVLAQSKGPTRVAKQTIVTSCRAAAAIDATWSGEGLKLASSIQLLGWSDSHLVNPRGDSDDESDNENSVCNFVVRELDYKVTVAGDKVTLTHPKATMSLVRTTAIAKREVNKMAIEYAKKKGK